jgi:hypothetical protein
MRSRTPKAILLCLVLALFLVKNIILTVLFLMDEAPNFNPLLFADVVVVVAMLVGMARR